MSALLVAHSWQNRSLYFLLNNYATCRKASSFLQILSQVSMNQSNKALFGISLKPSFYDAIMKINPGTQDTYFLEVHTENYLYSGYHQEYLKKLAKNFSISLHGVSLSLGSPEPPCLEHLKIRKKLIQEIAPCFVSEHASRTHYQQHLNDLLPVAFSKKNINIFVDNIDYLQNYYGRQILVENLSSYVHFDDHDMSEAEFFNEICSNSGCGLLLDINNLYIQEFNLNYSSSNFLDTINPDYIQQYHLAGGEYSDKHNLIIDTHSCDVPDLVLDLYKKTISIIGERPTLYERDKNIPSLEEMFQCIQKIKNYQNNYI